MELKLPKELNDHIYAYLNTEKRELITGSLTYNYVRSEKFTESNWNELKQVLAVYYSPLYQALL